MKCKLKHNRLHGFDVSVKKSRLARILHEGGHKCWIVIVITISYGKNRQDLPGYTLSVWFYEQYFVRNKISR